MSEEIERRIRAALTPSYFQIIDETGAHAHHHGAREQPGAGHYQVTIVSAAFEGKSLLARHRMVYDALGDLMIHAIHALQIDAKSPSESAL
jgi:BolA protein